uniref:EGF-like domain-containing protein n=1 Tax=Panagrellus redivivus TaxID=6233 RepID=A0A7E4VCF4_PANRE
MRLCLLFFMFLGAFADEVSILDYLNATDVLQHADCPPLFHGSNCTIPYCFPDRGHLVQRSPDDYYCKCTHIGYTSGEHCEIVNCHYGKLSNSTLECECPDYVDGSYCQNNNILVFTTLLGVCCSIVFLVWLSSIIQSNTTKKADQPRKLLAPAVRNV